jgi:hypothetical protein
MEALRMVSIAYGGLPAQAVAVAAQLGIVDHLAEGPRTAADLAGVTGTDAPSLYRLLRALATMEVLAEDEEGRFSSTPLGDTLRSDAPGSIRAAVIMAGDPTFTRPCGEMAHSVRTGGPAFDHVFGAPIFEYLTTHPEAGAIFNRGMANFSAMENPAIAASYDFPAGSRVADVGGGRGGFIAEVLKAHPGVRGVLYDLAEVVCEPTYLAAAGVADRCEVIPGDFFSSVPSGADVYVVKRILHDWADEECIRILGNLRRAMSPTGRVLAIDAVIAAGGQPDMNKVSDLLMMVVTPGRERTEAEFRRLYAAADLRLSRVIPTPSALSIIEGTPAA